MRACNLITCLLHCQGLINAAPATCREVYDAASPGYRGRCTAPLLVDKRTRKLVCNESSDILRMLNSVQLPGSTPFDLYPPHLSAEIDAVNDLVFNKVLALSLQPVCNHL